MKIILYKVITLSTILIMMSCTTNDNRKPRIIDLVNSYENDIQLSFCAKWDKWLVNTDDFDVTTAFDSYDSYLEEELKEVLLDDTKNTLTIIDHGTGGGQAFLVYNYLGKMNETAYVLVLNTEEDPMFLMQKSFIIRITDKVVKKESLCIPWGMDFLGIEAIQELKKYGIFPIYTYDQSSQLLTAKLHCNPYVVDHERKEYPSNIKKLVNNKHGEIINYKWVGDSFIR